MAASTHGSFSRPSQAVKGVLGSSGLIIILRLKFGKIENCSYMRPGKSLTFSAKIKCKSGEKVKKVLAFGLPRNPVSQLFECGGYKLVKDFSFRIGLPTRIS
ncbi:hypothetical protein M8C21_018911 [Ambrosia artemisiifolia]|uniref:Uncharacterized protein n=1 Tax=Ambrosia artemisiifolia TaxID=4212 RepID=A0AAD5D6L7_AMBAR|nr:hypothetical protein M8C21_018911 [Ambrosia artemisiifolia]